MNPHLCRVALRPRSPFEVFDLTLRLLRERVRVLAWMSLFVVLPAFVLCLGVAWLADFALWTMILPIALAPIIQAPFTVLGGRLLFQEEVSPWSTLGATVRSVGPVFVTMLAEVISWVLVCTGFGIALLPGLVYLPETALLERVDIGRGFQRSLRLASGQVGVAVVAASARWVLWIWGALAAELGGQILVGFVLQLGSPFGSLLEGSLTPFAIAGILLSHVVFALYRLLLYVDVRTRMEGWDLQVGLRALGLAHGSKGAV